MVTEAQIFMELFQRSETAQLLEKEGRRKGVRRGGREKERKRKEKKQEKIKRKRKTSNVVIRSELLRFNNSGKVVVFKITFGWWCQYSFFGAHLSVILGGTDFSLGNGSFYPFSAQRCL